MSQVNITEAARLVRKNRTTIHRAIAQGKLSVTRDAQGNRLIDLAELQRVYGALKGGATAAQDAHALTSDTMQHAETVQQLQQQIVQLQAEKERLYTMLEAAAEERKQILMALSPAVRNGEPQDTAQAVDAHAQNAHAGTGGDVQPDAPKTFLQRLRYVIAGKA